jgi:hypothetical protein
VKDNDEEHILRESEYEASLKSAGFCSVSKVMRWRMDAIYVGEKK